MAVGITYLSIRAHAGSEIKIDPASIGVIVVKEERSTGRKPLRNIYIHIGPEVDPFILISQNGAFLFQVLRRDIILSIFSATGNTQVMIGQCSRLGGLVDPINRFEIRIVIIVSFKKIGQDSRIVQAVLGFIVGPFLYISFRTTWVQ